MAYTESVINNGDDGTPTWAHHVQTQYDEVVAEIGLGNIVGPASMISSGQLNISRMPRAASGVLKANGTGSDPSYQSLVTGDIPAKVATMILSAGGAFPRKSNGCAPVAITELSTNKLNFKSLDFDGAAIEYAYWPGFAMPDGYTGGAMTVKVKWTAASGTAGNGVVWYVAAVMVDDDGALDVAMGTAAKITDYFIAANDLHKSSGVSMTPGGSPAGGKDIFFIVYRDPTDGSDTLTSIDAKLLGLAIEYPTAYTD